MVEERLEERLARCAAGEIRVGYLCHYRRTSPTGRVKTGWISARSVGQSKDGERVWINGIDLKRQHSRAVLLDDITRVRKAKPS